MRASIAYAGLWMNECINEYEMQIHSMQYASSKYPIA